MGEHPWSPGKNMTRCRSRWSAYQIFLLRAEPSHDARYILRLPSSAYVPRVERREKNDRADWSFSLSSCTAQHQRLWV